MSSKSFAADLAAATPKERIAKYREMAAEATQSAASAKHETRAAYINLARQLSMLADEIESGQTSKSPGPTGGER